VSETNPSIPLHIQVAQSKVPNPFSQDTIAQHGLHCEATLTPVMPIRCYIVAPQSYHNDINFSLLLYRLGFMLLII
jgi:hypothetical protein